METWLRSEKAYDGKIVNLRTGVVRLEDGTEATREVVEHPGAVGIVPLLNESVLLVRQFRIAAGKEVLEIPAGKLEGDEDPVERGHAELEEEVGYRAGQLEAAGAFFPSVGILTEKIYLYLAFDLTKTQQNPEDDERIEVVEMTLDEVEQNLAAHRFEDAKTIVGLYALLARLGRKLG